MSVSLFVTWSPYLIRHITVICLFLVCLANLSYKVLDCLTQHSVTHKYHINKYTEKVVVLRNSGTIALSGPTTIDLYRRTLGTRKNCS